MNTFGFAKFLLSGFGLRFCEVCAAWFCSTFCKVFARWPLPKGLRGFCQVVFVQGFAKFLPGGFGLRFCEVLCQVVLLIVLSSFC